MSGRPHGGVAFICKKKNSVSYKVLNVNSDRVCAIQVINNHNVVCTIIGVYMPYFCDSSEQTELYVDVLDYIQDIVDTYSPDSPLMIMGDFNVSLPKALHLSSGWYKSRPYNRHSVLLYDFICNNELIVANFEFDQKVDYTYRKSNCSSYIDHCLVTRQLTDMVKECRILLEDQDSTSDHLPVWILIELPIHEDQCIAGQKVKYTKMNWKSKQTQYNYFVALESLASSIPVLEDVEPRSHKDVQDNVNGYYQNIVNVMHRASQIAMGQCNNRKGQGQSQSHKPKFCRNIDCTTARNRHRFWFHIWQDCGRPRVGAIYDTYKHSKSSFRKSCSLAVNQSINFNFNACDTLFKQKRMGFLWNKVRKARSKGEKSFSSLSIGSLEEHFKEKFSYDMANENEFVQQARKAVLQKVESSEAVIVTLSSVSTY